ncbi:MAG: MFS transporter [Geminicoccaceae bacterium]|nr:MFS transporter [Geminicoccaceae bacterium]
MPRLSPPVVIAFACLIALVTFGARAGFGLFLAPISAANGWGREVFALAIGIQNICWGLGQPVAGALADRYGTRPVLIAGSLVYAAGLVLMGQASTPEGLHVTAGFLVGVGGAAASFGLVLAAVGRMVSEERRSMALGLVVAASSMGQFLLVPLGQAFLSAYGYPTALAFLGALVLIVVPLSLPFGREAGACRAATEAAQTLAQALGEAGASRSFWLLTAGFFVCGYHVAFIQTHLPAFIVDQGVAASIGALAIGFVGLFNVIGSFGAGFLGGRFPKHKLLSLLYLARAVVIAVYVSLPITAASTLVFAACMGLLWLSTVPLTSGLVALLFGPRYMATLFGIVFLSHQLGALLGVWLGGRVFDLTGSYTGVWWGGVGLALVAALLHWPIEERPVARLRPA